MNKAKKNEWPAKKLGDTCKIIAGQSPEGKFYNKANNGLPFYQGKKEFGEKYIEEPTTWTTQITKEAEANDILMSVRAPVGPVNFATQKICIGRGLAAIRPSKLMDKDFLFYFLQKHESEIVGNEGAVFNSISKTQIGNIQIPLPPLSEQQRIVTILEKSFAAIEKAKKNTEKNLENAKEVFESYLKSIFTNKHGEWEQQKLKDVCSKITVGHVGSMANQYKDHGIPFLRSQNIQPFFVKLDNVVFIDGTFNKLLKKSQLEPGDLAIVRTGYPGTAAVIPEDLKISNCSDLVIVRPKESIDPYYLAFFFNSAHGKKLVAGNLVGAAQKHFNVTAAKQVIIPMPSIYEQKNLVIKLSKSFQATQKLQSLYQQKLADLEELKKSLLKKAFNGEL